MQNYKTIDLFAGAGGLRLGFESFGCKNVFSSEIDPYAQKIYEANFGEIPFGDINLIKIFDNLGDTIKKEITSSLKGI